jgi:Lysylphosphatidylglycerol synthase TM region
MTTAATVSETPSWRRIAPFALAAVLIATVMWRIDRGQFAASIGRTNLPWFVAFSAIFTVVLLIADSIASRYVYRTLAGPITLRQLVTLRGASYLAGLINHNVGQAWLTFAIARTCSVPVLRVTGATLLVYVTTLACVFGLGVVSLVLAPDRFAWLPTVFTVAACGVLTYVVVLALRPAWFVRSRLTAPLAEAGIRGHVVALALRAPHVAVLFLGTWLPFRFFGVHIPLVDALALVPGLMVLVALPITPQGVGTRDLFAVQVFTAYALGTPAEREATVAAATLCWAVALTLVQIPLSLAMVRFASTRWSWAFLPI